jgi:sugar phosphate isomerase/epimerase
MNRRNFIGTSLCAAAPVSLAAAAPAPAGFRLGCVTYNALKDHDLPTIIRILESTGFDGVELRTEHKHGVEPTIGAAERAQVRSQFERSKVKLVSYGTTCEFHSADAAVRKKHVETGKLFTDLAKDTGALGIKVRPNGFAKEVSREETIRNIGASLRELGDYAAAKGIAVWMEVHGRETSKPPVCADIMKAANHPNVGLCWNSNADDVVDGSVRHNWNLLKPWVRHAHINELAGQYPYRELFTLMRESGYRGYTLAELQPNGETERFLRWYKALWTELNRTCS